jgi:hypothetical protein
LGGECFNLPLFALTGKIHLEAAESGPGQQNALLAAHYLRGDPTMFRIERTTDGGSTVLKLSGRIEEEQLAQLLSEIEQSGEPPKLDLRDVCFVDRSSVRFLIRCESRGIQLVNCPLYVKEWISRERSRKEFRTGNE